MIRFNTILAMLIPALRTQNTLDACMKKNYVDDRHLCYQNVLGHLAVQDWGGFLICRSNWE